MSEVTGGDGDLLQAAVAELYSADPDEFIARRGELAAGARTAGQAAVAKQIGALRKPTRSAWVVNRLVRADPDVAAQLAMLGAELRAAQQSLDGPAVRELSRQRRELIDALARQAFSVSGQKSPPAALRDEVAATFGAALADPQVAEQLQAGALERVVRRDGLEAEGEPPLGEALSAALGRPAVPRAMAADDEPRRGFVAADDELRRLQPRGSGSRGSGSRRGPPEDQASPTVVPLLSTRRRSPAVTDAAAEARPAAQVTALAAARTKADRTKADRAKAEQDRHQQALAAAERAVAAAEQAEREAAQVEQEQQNAVQLLEEQLADARQRLAEARIRAHRARTGQRQAQRALDRLQRAPRS